MGQRNKRILSQDEIKAIYKQINDNRGLMMVKIGVKHGLRVSEIVSLQRRHIDLDEQVIDIEEGKGRKDRLVPIPSEFLPELQEYIADLAWDDYLFPNGRGSHLSEKWMQDKMHEWVVPTGIYPDHVTVDNVTEEVPDRERITPHSLRHTFATTHLRNDTPMERVSKLLGHESVQTTIDEYGHLAVTDVAEDVDRVQIG